MSERQRVRFLVIGGFLGAGKTTALLRLAAHYQSRGLNVGLITNDQAPNLVDTGSLRASGFRVEEVAGACFCCKFDDLVGRAEKLGALAPAERPDVLIGEPVGSCTDLAATVVQPLRRLYGERWSIAPYAVLVDPTRARQIVLERGFGGFSQKVAYIFQKQLEEADLIGLNKVDLLTPAQRDTLLAALRREFPKATVVPLSGLTGAGFPEFCAELERDMAAGRNIAAVDYDVYAEGEAELGWLNLTLDLEAATPLAGETLVRELLVALTSEVAGRGEVAHAKILFQPDGTAAESAAVANHVGGGSPVAISRGSAAAARSGRLVINARVHLAPEELRAAADRALAATLPRHGATARVAASAQFRPGRPVPIHRVAPSEAS